MWRNFARGVARTFLLSDDDIIVSRSELSRMILSYLRAIRALQRAMEGEDRAVELKTARGLMAEGDVLVRKLLGTEGGEKKIGKSTTRT